MLILYRIVNNDCFNSCPREGAIDRDPDLGCDLESFNSCPREGAILEQKLRNAVPNSFQLMPPRGGNPESEAKMKSILKVSTHAPARGQSLERPYTIKKLSSFNSCPREGAIVFWVSG